MHILHHKVIDCSSMTPVACSDLLLVKLLHGPTFKLRADMPTDTVHGSVTIAHNTPPNPHEIIVEIYEVDEPPAPNHPSTLKRPAPMTSEDAIRARLDLP